MSGKVQRDFTRTPHLRLNGFGCISLHHQPDRNRDVGLHSLEPSREVKDALVTLKIQNGIFKRPEQIFVDLYSQHLEVVHVFEKFSKFNPSFL